MVNGQKFTLPAARYLINLYRNSELQVFYDHGDHSSQRIYSWFGTTYTTPYTDQHLSWIDIIVAEPKLGKIHKIIEIEDSTAKPKTIIGDMMAVLLGDGIALASRSDWQMGNWTTLTTLAYVSRSNAQIKYQTRLDHIKKQIESFQSCLKTRNAKIGHIILESFKDIGELQNKLTN